MLRRFWPVALVAALMVFPALFAAASAAGAQATATPVPLTPQPTFSATPPPPSPFPTVQFQPTPAPITPEAAAPTAAGPLPLSPGESFAGTLAAGQVLARHAFSGRAGQVVAFWITSPNEPVPLTLSLSNDVGYSVRGVAGVGETFVHTLPDTAAYEIHVTHPTHPDQGHGEIAYTLTLDFLAPQPVAYGERIEGEMSPQAPARLFTFQGAAGDVVRANLTAWRFGSYMVLEGVGDRGGYRELAGSVRFGSVRFGGIQQIGPLVLPDDGEYRIIARSQRVDFAPAPFVLALDRIDPAPLAYGETVEGELAAGDHARYYRFDGAFGDIVDIQVVAEDDADTVLCLYGGVPWRLLGCDDDSGRGLDPEMLGYLLNQAGMVIVEIAPAVAGDSAAFALSLARSPEGLLDEGPRRVKHADRTLSFTGRAGEAIRLVIDVDQGVNTPMVTVTQGENVLLTINPSSVERLAADFDVPVDGVVLVRLSSGGYAESVVTVSVERR